MAVRKCTGLVVPPLQTNTIKDRCWHRVRVKLQGAHVSFSNFRCDSEFGNRVCEWCRHSYSTSILSIHWQVTDPVMANVGKTDEKKSEEATEATPVPATAGEKFTFFFGAESPFSQWHPAVFTLDGVEYNCAEQYMMSQKAGQSCGLARTEAGKAWKQGEFN